jgi:membrane-associated phospholipid phosphatase
MGLLFALKISSDLKRMGRMATFLNQFSPIPFIVLIYESLGDLIQYLQPDIDPWLIKIDLFLFGVHPTLWMEQWIVPWLTDLLSLAYVSYYFLPVILVGTLYLKNRMSDFDECVFILAFGYYLSFIGYLLFPAIGPRFTLTPLYSAPLEGSFITDWVRDVLNALEHNRRDCMPSGHTQIVLMVLSRAHRYEKVLFYIFLPIICGLLLSTVYLRYHYVFDLISGCSCVVSMLMLRTYRIWNCKKDE